jgi:colanic acid/amylovoran biosynthesis glycosyltransferase
MSADANAKTGSLPGPSGIVLVVALCGVEILEGTVLIDQKFHEGMQGYLRRLSLPMACLLPRLPPSATTPAPGLTRLPLSKLDYEVFCLEGPVLDEVDSPAIERLLDRCALVYLGEASPLNFTVARMCRERGIPYASTTEYTLRTSLDIMRAGTPSALRRLVREVRFRGWNRSRLELVRGAAEIHANGYPTYMELAPFNPHRLLYFDTRAQAADVVSEDTVLSRIGSLDRRAPRLVFSGRYHSMKGALDVVRVGIELRRRGVEHHLHTYGAGPLRPQMEELARQGGAADAISIHDPIPYRPDLIEVTRQADLFIACHVQGDPSCTYLETFACGVPIAGYQNEMWSLLQKESGGGLCAPVGDVQGLADAVAGLLRDRPKLREVSLCARAFAAVNTMEVAWDRRAARLSALAAARRRRA